MSNSTRLIIGLCLIATALAAQQFGQFPWRNGFTNSLSNWMHVPMFTLLTGTLMWIRPNWTIIRIVVIVGLLAVTTEALQMLTYRQASVTDLLLDALGCGIALACLRSFGVHRLVLCAVVCGFITVTIPARFLIAYAYQKQVFPTLYTPADLRSNILLESHAETARISNHNWQQYRGQPILSATWRRTRWPGIHMLEPVDNWQGYNYLVVDAFNLEAQAQPLTAGVRHARQGGTSRYQQQFLQPGHNQLRFALTDLAFDDSGLPARIHHLMLYTSQKHAGKRILLGTVRLE